MRSTAPRRVPIWVSALLAGLAMTFAIVPPISATAAGPGPRWPVSLQPPTLRSFVSALLWDLLLRESLLHHVLEPTSLHDDALVLGQSWGRAFDGRLHAATQLPAHPTYHRRRPARAYGTRNTVTYLMQVIGRVSAEYPGLHKLAVGDLSAPFGGPLPGHRSHQSGRDVDVGLYFRKRPRGYPHVFAPARRNNLHFQATWALIEALAETAGTPDGVDYILLDYEVQRMLHAWAKSQNVPEETLARILQYPRGRHTEAGIVRHFPKHMNHLHVRFKCPPTDLLCT